jgi:hypothetical protein
MVLMLMDHPRRHYNGVRPHASLGYRAPAPEVFVPSFAAAGCVTPASSAGHAPAGAETVPKLTLPPDHSNPFVWKADLSRVLAAIERGKQALESVH